MTNAELAFKNRNISLSPRSFVIRDGLSQPFDAYVTAGSRAADLDLEAIAGHAAAFRLAMPGDGDPYAVWSGICSQIEQVSIEDDGLSIYALRIVPMLWRTTQRNNFRIFQHDNHVDVVCKVLDDWEIEPELRLEPGSLPQAEYRVQFGESDFGFISRMLESAGISYFLEQVDARGESKLESMRLVLTGKPGDTAARLEEPIPFIGQTADSTEGPCVRNVRFGRAVRPGRFTVAGYDYRSSQELRLLAEAQVRGDLERRYEQFHYIRGAFLEEVTERDRMSVKASEKRGEAEASLGLERSRTRQRTVGLSTNQLGLAPGMMFSIDGHPRPELARDKPLLVVERNIEGEVDGEWNIQLEAALASDPFRPSLKTPKPRVMGIQSAVVVGPEGEEIYTDALGRVRVQFHWDRYGKRNEDSSCWIRVSQGWAGSGYGMSAIPRIGHEVLVDFFEGDPDQPIIVGRAYNRGASPPDALPQKMTKTTWRSNTSPGGEGFNEISMDDARGEEVLFMHAQRDLETTVLNDDKKKVGANLETTVRKDERHNVEGDQSVHVSGNRVVDVDGRYATRSDSGIQTQSGETTGLSCVDGKLVLTNGSASIVLDGPHIHIDAQANLRASAGGQMGLYGKQVSIDGTPEVFINSGEAVPPTVAQLSVGQRADRGRQPADRRGGREQPVRRGDGRPRRPEGMREADFERQRRYRELMRPRPRRPADAPRVINLPDGLNSQLKLWSKRTRRVGIKQGVLIDPDTYNGVVNRLDRRLDAEAMRIQNLGRDLRGIFARNRNHMVDLGNKLEARHKREQVEFGKLGDDFRAIFDGEEGNFIKSSAAFVKVAGKSIARVAAIAIDTVTMLAQEYAYAQQFIGEMKGAVTKVQETIDHFKELIQEPQQMLREVLGDDLADLLGIEAPGRDLGRGGRDIGGGRTPMPGDRPIADRPIAPGGRGTLNQRGQRHFLENPKQGPDAKPSLNERGAQRGFQKGASGPSNSSLNERGRQNAMRPKGGMPQEQSSLNQRGARAGIDKGVKGPEQLSGRGAQRGLAKGGKMSPMQQQQQMGGDMPEGFNGFDSDSKLNAGTAFSRDGGLAANDVVSNVGTDRPAFLQSPGDGQMMVVATDAAQPLNSAQLSSGMVDAQMNGHTAQNAIAQQLTDNGYAVYTRESGNWFGELVKHGADAASA